MDYEKAYKEAFERAKQVHSSSVDENKKSAEYIFPELNESEDEKIRKWLIGYFQRNKIAENIKTHDILAWLEKQGKQKSIDKVEPKFNVGDWVMLDRPVLITKVEDMPYNTHQYWTSDGTWFGDATKAKSWTIQDAKDGDVLQLGNVTAIFKKFIGNKKCYCYCSVWDGKFEIPTQSDSYECYIATPATKEQRDLLEKAMTDAGYTFDFEKKELSTV